MALTIAASAQVSDTLDASKSIAYNGATIVKWEWSQTSGTNTSMTGIKSPVMVVTFTVPGTYSYELKLTDSKGYSSITGANITVNQDMIPKAVITYKQIVNIPPKE